MATRQILENLKGVNLENLKASEDEFHLEEQGHSLTLMTILSDQVMKIFSWKVGSNNREFIQVVSCFAIECFSSCNPQIFLR